MNVISEVPQVVIGGGWHEVTGESQGGQLLYFRPGTKRGYHSHWTSEGKDKKTYVSEQSATEAAEKLVITYGKAMDAYKCTECSNWHLGTCKPKLAARHAQKKKAAKAARYRANVAARRALVEAA